MAITEDKVLEDVRQAVGEALGVPVGEVLPTATLFDDLGIVRMVSGTRLSGLASVRMRMKQIAAEFAARCAEVDSRAAVPRT